MPFTESSTVETMIRDLLCGQQKFFPAGIAQKPATYVTFGRAHMGSGWHFIPALDLPRHINDVFIEEYVRQALIRLNPSIAENPERADEVLYCRCVRTA